jgi:hypothetical protein
MEKVFEIMINCALEKRGGIFDYNEPVSIENVLKKFRLIICLTTIY